MTEHRDPILRLLSQLPMEAPDPNRAAEVRRRCHDAVVRSLRAAQRRQRIRRAVAPVAVGALSIIYVAALVLDLVQSGVYIH